MPNDVQGGAEHCFDPTYIPPGMIDTTQGQLSNGVSFVTTLNGGDDNDLFLVFHNRAVLNLNGEDGDDTFVIRTFLEEDSETQVVAGAGADSISYVTNSPVNVNGGDGYDTLFVIGTEADDFFVLTAAGVYGAGRYVAFVAIERLGIDGAEGNDTITVLATPPGVDVEVYGGLGSDTIDVAGDAPVVAADDLTGHSGLITHSVESSSGLWNGRPIDGIAAEVADDDEPAIVITQSGGDTVVYESGGTDSYTIQLTRAPTTDVRITVLTAELTPDQARRSRAQHPGVARWRDLALGRRDRLHSRQLGDATHGVRSRAARHRARERTDDRDPALGSRTDRRDGRQRYREHADGRRCVRGPHPRRRGSRDHVGAGAGRDAYDPVPHRRHAHARRRVGTPRRHRRAPGRFAASAATTS